MNKMKMITSIIDYIEDNINQKIELEHISKSLYYSKYYLHHTFSELVGVTIHDYIQRRQLSESAKLLIFSRQSILDIALVAGYETQQSYTKSFKLYYKKTPKQFRDDQIFYPLQLPFSFNDIYIKGNNDDFKVEYAQVEDIQIWMSLVDLVIDGFPYFNKSTYLQVLNKSIKEKRAFIIKNQNIAIASMILSFENNSIDFIGIHPLYKRYDLARKLLDKAMIELTGNMQITTTTYRENDKADNGHRNGLKELGFAEAELLIEYGYPTQKFIFKIDKENDDDEK